MGCRRTGDTGRMVPTPLQHIGDPDVESLAPAKSYSDGPHLAVATGLAILSYVQQRPTGDCSLAGLAWEAPAYLRALPA